MQDLSNILAALRREFSRLLGSQVDALYLYGSQARGDSHSGSDIDVLVVINGEFDDAEEIIHQALPLIHQKQHRREIERFLAGGSTPFPSPEALLSSRPG